MFVCYGVKVLSTLSMFCVAIMNFLRPGCRQLQVIAVILLLSCGCCIKHQCQWVVVSWWNWWTCFILDWIQWLRQFCTLHHCCGIMHS